jgi:RHH-type transcriptional regulator, proline utilization regulon repressor / proline dehydrogenase / delta 1-pyrroline-5-carboxylate dehydrogenase
MGEHPCYRRARRWVRLDGYTARAGILTRSRTDMALFSKKPAKPVSPSIQPPAPADPVGGDATLEPRVQEIGRRMLELARGHKTGLLSSKFYSDWLMEWSMKDPNFKVQMFRFVDCFPMLRDADDTYEHLRDYLSQPGVTVPTAIATGIKAGGLAKGLFVSTMSKQIQGMAGKFIAGTDARSALPNLADRWKDGIAFSVDLLGEACVSDEEAGEYQKKYLDLIQNLPGSVSAWKGNPRLESDHLGPIPRTNVSIKISSLSARCDPIDTQGSIADLMKRLLPILETARDKGVFVNFDMEQFALKDLTLELFERCCEKIDFQAGLAMQAYLRSGEADARRIVSWAKRTGKRVTVRLVKGAYWDYHVIHSEQMGWPCPVWMNKRDTDACFERMTDIFLDACPREGGAKTDGGVKLALGSHNVRSIAYALAGIGKRGLPDAALELQMLHGMADQLKHAGAEMGLRVREYVPVGEMIPGMAYLVRRLLENTSNESWLKAGFLDNADPGVLLRSPHGASATSASANGAVKTDDRGVSAPERHALSPGVPGVGDGRPFYTEPTRDFSDAKTRAAFAAAVAASRVPTVASDRTPADAARMLARADELLPAWRDADPEARAAVLTRAADAMRARRDELAGIMVKEAGKTWREADADVCEAIDFCEYYARLAVPMFRRSRLGKFLGELDEVWYQPRGPAVVISPWNFPLAICCGMTVAALVTGNPVVVKPAEQTPGIAKVMCDLLWSALEGGGHARDLVQFCPGPGETTGAALVRDPRTAMVAFTGSRDVGLDIMNAAAPPTPFGAQRDAALSLAHVKRVVCEMGGKNALIIDTSADLDEAVLAVRQSAFGFQGQKCSACSRLIVVDPEGPTGPAITRVVHRLVEATRALTVGDPVAPGTDIGPVIDAEAQKKILGAIETAKREGCTLVSPVGAGEPGSVVTTGDGRTLHFVRPHIFSGVRPEHAIAREEIFGPVLAVMHAASFDEALKIANASPYKLTGGVFTRKPAHIEKAKREFRVGNLYLNRGITGALVARQPFGGFGMSGIGSKAGGADYLLQFVEPRASCENTMRRGFAPEL